MTSYLIPALLSVLVAAPAAAIVQPVILVGSATTFELRVIIVGSSTAAAGGIQEVTPAAGAFTVTISGQPAGAALADAAANPVTVSWGALLEHFNGTGWDRARGDTANGLDVDVTRIQTPVAVSNTAYDAIPAGLVTTASSYAVLVSTVAINLVPNALPGARHLLIQNVDGNSVAFGGPNVTASGTTEGPQLDSMDTMTFDATAPGFAVYAIRVGGFDRTVTVLRW